MKNTQELTLITNDEVLAAAQEVINKNVLPDNQILQIVNAGEAFVVVNGDDSAKDSTAPTHALRLTPSVKLEEDLSETKSHVNVLDSLLEDGAHVLQNSHDPQIAGRFVVTTAYYLPEAVVPMGAYGYAMAQTHNASLERDYSAILPAFSPLKDRRQTFEALKRRQEQGRPFVVEGSTLSERSLRLFGSYLTRAEESLYEMGEFAKEHGIPPVILQQDVHNENVRGINLKLTGARLIDMYKPQLGPAEFDLSRAETQWTQRLGRPSQERIDFLGRYYEVADRKPHPRMQEYANQVADIRFSTGLLGIVVQGVEAGQRVDPWLLQEAARRLDSLENPEERWSPYDAAQKQAWQDYLASA